MIEEILPGCVVGVEARHDRGDARLFPEELALLVNAVEKRRREFTTARACAREALARLGLPAVAILSGPRGEPLWPAAVVGSITHRDGYHAAALARADQIATVGIDAEPHAGLPDGLLVEIARAEELPMLHRLQHELPEVHWDRLLFSAKESVYKSWFPLAERWLGFENISIEIDAHTGVFAARILVPVPVAADALSRELSGRWTVGEGLILTAVVARPVPEA